MTPLFVLLKLTLTLQEEEYCNGFFGNEFLAQSFFKWEGGWTLQFEFSALWHIQSFLLRTSVRRLTATSISLCLRSNSGRVHFNWNGKFCTRLSEFCFGFAGVSDACWYELAETTRSCRMWEWIGWNELRQPGLAQVSSLIRVYVMLCTFSVLLCSEALLLLVLFNVETMPKFGCEGKAVWLVCSVLEKTCNFHPGRSLKIDWKILSRIDPFFYAVTLRPTTVFGQQLGKQYPVATNIHAQESYFWKRGVFYVVSAEIL